MELIYAKMKMRSRDTLMSEDCQMVRVETYDSFQVVLGVSE